MGVASVGLARLSEFALVSGVPFALPLLGADYADRRLLWFPTQAGARRRRRPRYSLGYDLSVRWTFGVIMRERQFE
jgi:hypothetical protein